MRPLDIRWPIIFLVIGVHAFFSAGSMHAGDEKRPKACPAIPLLLLSEGEFVLSAPYADVSEFKWIFPGFSVSADSGAPWGFAHLGLDLIVASGKARVIAPADGIVEKKELYQNEHNGQYQVNLRIRYDSEFVYHLLFEPRANTQLLGEKQFDAIITLQAGQKVKQGDFLGEILDLSGGDYSCGEATVHFDIWRGTANICPAPYFSPEAYAGMLGLVQAKFPGAELCYP
ncbi:MAG: Peptidase family M23 [Syntrophaceae bacterium PtaB.Bin095]|jgi:murein DD-endopeptidase MepM/ murein hydrolase activator NlpD|nr:MAG: Peptidase family M23 [Syntrophaceae bacterium PtaB.Bin095]